MKEGFRPNGAPKRSRAASARGDSAAVPEKPQAPFAIAEIQPVDSSMWPIHQGLWLQPDQPPSLPGCVVDAARRHRLPSGDFAERNHIQPLDAAAERGAPAGPVPPHGSVTIPASDLAPLGWDPRMFRGSVSGVLPRASAAVPASDSARSGVDLLRNKEGIE
jgi:hypothetical protein